VRRGEIFALAGFGFVLGVAVVVSWGRLGPEPGSRNPSKWLGLLAVVAPNDASKAGFLYVLVPALFLLTLGWWQLLRLATAYRLGTRAAAMVAAAWALPFTVGPVIGSRDAYAYVAQGELARRGLDPTRAVVSQLGPGPLLAAVDPRWRDTRPPYGGVAVAIQKAAAAADSRPGVSLLVLRLVALCAVLVLVAITLRMAAPASRPIVVAAIAANPLVLVHLIAGAHLDAVAAALLVAGLAVAQGGDYPGCPSSRNAHRRWLGIVLCTLGAMVKLPVALGAGYLSLCALVAAGPSLAARLRSAVTDVLAVAGAVALSMGLSGGGLGWLHNFGTPGRLRTGIAPADIGANLVRGVGWLVGLHPGAGHVLSTARVVAAGIGIVVALILLRPRRSASPDAIGGWVPPSRDRLGLALLALGLLGPVLYGWYLAPALPLLALAASRCPGTAQLLPGTARRRLPGNSAATSGQLPAGAAGWTIVGLSAVLTFATIPSLAPVWASLGAHPKAIVAASVAAALAAVPALVIVTRELARARAAGAGSRLG